MCRMFAYVGDSEDELCELIFALDASARRDPIAKAERKPYVHSDGWGFVIASKEGVYRFRSPNPIFKERISIPVPKTRFIAMFHARDATDKIVAGKRFSHPLLAETGDSMIFLAHNGYFKRGALARALHVKKTPKMLDTELALEYIKRNGVDKTADLEKYSAKGYPMNLFILEVAKKAGTASLYYISSFPGRGKYGIVCKKRYKKGSAAVFSSTLGLFMSACGTEVKPGKLAKLGSVDSGPRFTDE